MKRLSSSIIFMVLLVIQARGQGEIDDQKKIFYRNEKSGAILLNSNGFGLSYRAGKWLDDRNKRIFEVDFNYVKHPKEIKFPYYNYYSTGSYIYGKVNTMFSLRGGPGFQHEIYQKVDKGGISIRRIFTVGPALAIYKPIYYDVYKVVGQEIVGKESKKFDVNLQHVDIIGRSSFLKGINETKVVPGVYGKACVSFEYSTVDQIIHAIEAGVTLEVYPKRIPIMYTDKNPFAFVALFISYRFGKILNPLKPKEGEENIPPVF